MNSSSPDKFGGIKTQETGGFLANTIVEHELKKKNVQSFVNTNLKDSYTLNLEIYKKLQAIDPSTLGNDDFKMIRISTENHQSLLRTAN